MRGTGPSFRSFNLAFASIVVLLLGAIGALNYVVDPYFYFRVIEIKGFNLDKPRGPANERLVKTALAARLRPEAVIVGSSFAEIGLPPTHPGFTEHGAYTSFNLSLHGIGWDDIYCLSRFAITRVHARRLVVTIHGTKEANCPSDDQQGRVDYAKLLFSRDAVDASIATLRRQDGHPHLTREGVWFMARYEEKMQDDDAIARNFVSELRGGLCPAMRTGLRSGDRPDVDKSPTAPDQGIGLRKLIRLALQNNVDLVLLFNPTHVLFNEVERTCNGAAAHWQFLWQVVSIADEETGGHPERVPVWDFYAYAPINGERIHDGKPMRERLWQDAGHYNNEVGSRVFDAIYSGATDYGAQVTVRNFDSVVARAEEDRRTFLADNPWVGPEIDEIIERNDSDARGARP